MPMPPPSPKTDKSAKRRAPSDDKHSMMRSASLAMMIPGLMLAGPILGFLLGRWIGATLFDRSNLGAVLGLVAGCVASGREVVRVLRRLGKE